VTGPTEILPRGNPRAQGFDPAGLDEFVAAVDRDALGVHSVMVLRHGHVVAEEWWAPYTADQPHLMFSVSKAFTSTAIGLAVSEGKLDLDEPVLNVFPSYGSPRIRRIMGEVRVRHLLSMASGQVTDTMQLMRNLPEHDWVEIFLSVAPEYPPGTHFLYNSGASHVLSAIVQSRTGQTVHDYLTPRIFEPLGIPDPFVESSPRGINLGGSGFRLRTEDLAALGQLYLRRGEWNGKQLLPEEWVDEASSNIVSTASHDNPDWKVGYGFQLWRGQHNSFRADGAFGQFSLVLPDQDAVVALTSGSQETQKILDAVWNHLLPALSGAPAESPAPAATRRHPELSLPVPAQSGSHQPVDFAGQTVRLEYNVLGLADLTLRDDGDALTVVAHDTDAAEHAVRCGRSGWVSAETAVWSHEEPPSAPLTVAGLVADEGTDSVTLVWQFVQTPFRWTITIKKVDEGSAELTMELNLSFRQGRNETVRGSF
jgi:CubicO group peptidase (beta-lactamase class C family)